MSTAFQATMCTWPHLKQRGWHRRSATAARTQSTSTPCGLLTATVPAGCIAVHQTAKHAGTTGRLCRERHIASQPVSSRSLIGPARQRSHRGRLVLLIRDCLGLLAEPGREQCQLGRAVASYGTRRHDSGGRTSTYLSMTGLRSSRRLHRPARGMPSTADGELGSAGLMRRLGSADGRSNFCNGNRQASLCGCFWAASPAMTGRRSCAGSLTTRPVVWSRPNRSTGQAWAVDDNQSRSGTRPREPGH